MVVSHRNFSAWIETTADPKEPYKAITEYEVAIDPQTNRVACWIPSEAGKCFRIHWKDDGTGIDSAAYIVLDGFTVAGRFLQGKGETNRSGVRVSPTEERPFVFAAADKMAECASPMLPTVRQTVDAPNLGLGSLEASSSSNKDRSKDLGMITLKIKQIRKVGPRAPNGIQSLPSPPPPIVTDQRVDYGGASPYWLQHPTTWETRPYDENNPGSFVKFVFRYRSQEFLQTQGIMPREKGHARRASSASSSATGSSSRSHDKAVAIMPPPNPFRLLPHLPQPFYHDHLQRACTPVRAETQSHAHAETSMRNQTETTRMQGQGPRADGEVEGDVIMQVAQFEPEPSSDEPTESVLHFGGSYFAEVQAQQEEEEAQRRTKNNRKGKNKAVVCPRLPPMNFSQISFGPLVSFVTFFIAVSSQSNAYYLVPLSFCHSLSSPFAKS